MFGHFSSSISAAKKAVVDAEILEASAQKVLTEACAELVIAQNIRILLSYSNDHKALIASKKIESEKTSIFNKALKDWMSALDVSLDAGKKLFNLKNRTNFKSVLIDCVNDTI